MRSQGHRAGDGALGRPLLGTLTLVDSVEQPTKLFSLVPIFLPCFLVWRELGDQVAFQRAAFDLFW